MTTMYEKSGCYHKHPPHYTSVFRRTDTTQVSTDALAFEILKKLERLAAEYDFEIVDILFRRKSKTSHKQKRHSESSGSAGG